MNVPEIDVAVWLATWNWKLPHDFGSNDAGVVPEAHTPTIDGALDAGDTPAPLTALGAVTLFDDWKLQPAVNTAAIETATAEKLPGFIDKPVSGLTIP